MIEIGRGAQRAVSALDDVPCCERRCALPGDEDHFVEVTEMVDIGRDSAWCERRGCLTGDEAVGGERDLFQFTEKRRVEELEKTGEAEQWVSASFGGEGDGGSPFENLAVVVGKLQEDFSIPHGHDLADDSLSIAGWGLGQVNAEEGRIVDVEYCVVRAGVEQAAIGSRDPGLRIDHVDRNDWTGTNGSSLKRNCGARDPDREEGKLELVQPR